METQLDLRTAPEGVMRWHEFSLISLSAHSLSSLRPEDLHQQMYLGNSS